MRQDTHFFFLFRKYHLTSLASEVIDLTHPVNVDLFRKWDQKEVAYIDLLRFIRVTSTSPDVAVVSRPGKHPRLAEVSRAGDDEMTIADD